MSFIFRPGQLAYRLGAVLIAWSAAAVSAQTVTVVTSFPKELTAAYKAAFEKANPGTKVEILNKGTSSAVAFVREASPGKRADVFWASAPDAFEVMAKDGLLQKYDPGIKVPEKIGSYPINDPKGFYRGQALAGYGMMWNTRYLRANKLPEPREWVDLTKPIYFGHVSTSSPSRSGTTHLTIETILQGEGWEKGWSQVLQMAGNSAAITERSFGVPDGVSNGQFGIGIVIDFFGLAAKNSGFPVEFAYPSMTAIVPANIGLIEGAQDPEMGKRFIRFTLSPQGQELLLNPKISRLPVLPETYSKAPAGYPNPYDGKIQAKVNFDTAVSERRYYLVSALFDHTITFRHKELTAATRAIHEAGARLAAKPNAEGKRLLEEARRLAFTPIVNEDKVKDDAFVAVFRDTKRSAEKQKQMTGLEEYWGREARRNYEQATDLARKAAALAR